MENEIHVGTYLLPEDWTIGSKLEKGLEGFCDFYLPLNSQGPIKHIAANVKVTGKRPIPKGGTYWKRVKITWVGDGEMDTKTGGWILYNQEV